MKLNLLFRSLKNCLVAMGILVSASSSALASYSEVVFFGDSLTDTGNLYAATGNTFPPSPPYNNGRFSNGALWSETLSSWVTPSASSGSNYAWAGATVLDYQNPNRWMPRLPMQLAGYLGNPHPPVSSSALYVILGGANDISDLSGKDEDVARLLIADAAKAIDDMVDTLYAAGARNILVGNLPDIGLTPKTRALGTATFASELTSIFNSALQKSLAETEAADKDLDLDIFDLFALMNSAVATPSAYGFTNVTDSCLDPNNHTVCSTPDSYLFWDDFHPTAAAHLLIAQTALNAIPEPSTLLLFAVALLALLGLNPSKRSKMAI